MQSDDFEAWWENCCCFGSVVKSNCADVNDNTYNAKLNCAYFRITMTWIVDLHFYAHSNASRLALVSHRPLSLRTSFIC